MSIGDWVVRADPFQEVPWLLRLKDEEYIAQRSEHSRQKA